MPPKQRITREMILEKSFAMFCREGMEAVNARSVAKSLECSTQPIFSYYAGMDDLKKTLEEKAKETFENTMANIPEEGEPVVNMCRAYVGFAVEQPCLFKYLFIRSQEGPSYEFMTREQIAQLAKKEMAYTGLDEEKAKKALLHMSVYSHGFASMIAGGQMPRNIDLVVKTLEAAHKYIQVALNKEEA